MTPALEPAILVLDDEVEILTALTDLLEEHYRVFSASRAGDAMKLLAEHPEVAVILSDQRMPGMTGDVFLEEARKISDAEGILMTGYADLDAVVSAVNRGRIVGYVPKPWDPAVLLSLVDATVQRQRLSRQLITERTLLRGLLSSVDEAVSFKDGEGRFLRLNQLKADALGVSIEACRGRREGELTVWPPSAEQADREALERGVPSETVIEGVGPEGRQRWTLVRRTPIRTENGRAMFLMTSERDITEERLLDARMRQAEKLQALGTLAGGVAHDFNNLLTVILGNLELAGQQAQENARLSRLIKSASMAAQRGASLTQRLLGFSRQSEARSATVDVNDTVRRMHDLLHRTLGDNIRLTEELDPAAWPCLIDQDQLELAILNLCINARDAMPKGGDLLLRTGRASPDQQKAAAVPPGDYVAISVTDTGSGIPPEILERIFEPFFTTKEVGRGTGLGLSMVYGMVERAGGGISVESRVGEGTRVTFLLPRHDGEKNEEEEAAEAEPSLRFSARVLVVDDDPQVRSITAAYLAEFGLELAEAGNAKEALSLLERGGRLDLLVADFAMPGMNGVELASAVRERAPRLPVLLVTGYAELDQIPKEFPVMFKPFSRSELGARLRELIPAARRAPEASLGRARGR